MISLSWQILLFGELIFLFNFVDIPSCYRFDSLVGMNLMVYPGPLKNHPSYREIFRSRGRRGS